MEGNEPESYPSGNLVTPSEIVSKIIEMLSGERARGEAPLYIHPLVTIHMDSATYHGIEKWQRWVFLIRNRGRYRELRFVPHELSSDVANPCVVNLLGLWAGVSRVESIPCEASSMCHFRYRFEGGRAIELWTSKSNYAFVLGSWISFSVFFKLFAVWGILYFKWLGIRGRSYLIDEPE